MSFSFFMPVGFADILRHLELKFQFFRKVQTLEVGDFGYNSSSKIEIDLTKGLLTSDLSIIILV